MDAELRHRLERRLRELLAERKIKETITQVRDVMRYDKLDPILNTRLHDLYKQQGDHAATLEHGQQWLTALARAGQVAQAFAALRALRAIDPAFTARDGDVVLPVATVAMQARDAALAADLLRNFETRFPKHKDMPGVYLLGARLLGEQGLRQEEAARLARAVLTLFPDHVAAAEARAYLSVLENTVERGRSGT